MVKAAGGDTCRCDHLFGAIGLGGARRSRDKRSAQQARSENGATIKGPLVKDRTGADRHKDRETVVSCFFGRRWSETLAIRLHKPDIAELDGHAVFLEHQGPGSGLPFLPISPHV